MKSFKRIICIALSLFFVGTMSFDAKCVSTQKCEQNDNSAIKIVTALGIINAEDGCFNANDFVTRAKATEIAVKLLKMEYGLSPCELYFSDVNENHWACEYIELCCSQGIVNGMGNRLFKPDENITYHQMMKMLVCMTGWEVVALDYGGWNDGGYIYAAEQAGLIQNTPEDINKPVTYGEVAEMVCAALEIKIRDKTCSQQITNYTIRGLIWDLIKVKGVIEVINEKSLIVLVTDNYESSNSIYQVGKRYALDILNEDINLTVGDVITIYANEDDEIEAIWGHQTVSKLP